LLISKGEHMPISTMRVIVIDPFKKEIRYDVVRNPKINEDYSEYNEEIYALLSGGPTPVDVMEVAYLQTEDAKNRDSITVDENGLFIVPEVQKFFIVENAYPQPLAGIGVVTGSDNQGGTIETCLSLDWFKTRVKFYSSEEIKNTYGEK
jgi:hypothetical protein